MVSAAFLGTVLKVAASGLSAYKSSLDGDTAGVGASVSAGGALLLQEGAKEALGASWKQFFDAKPTTLLENAIAVVTCLEYINGMGNPDKGIVLTEIAKPNFDAALAYLKLALPDQRWSGTAATAYGELNKKIQECVKAVQSADKQLQGHVKAEAGLVFDVRSQFSYTKAGLVGCIGAAWGIYFSTFMYYTLVNPLGTAAAYTAALETTRKFQRSIIVVAFGALTTEWGLHKNNVDANANAMRASVPGQYDAAKAIVPLPNATAPRLAAPTSGGTTAPAFRTLSGAGGNTSGNSSRSYPVAGSRSYPVAGARPYPVAGATGGYGAATAQESEQSDAPPPPPPAPAAPATLVTPAAMSAAAALVQQAGQSIRSTVSQVTSTLQQAAPHDAKGAGKPPAPTDPDAGATVGAEGAERAPIETATVSPERAQEPSPAERFQ